MQRDVRERFQRQSEQSSTEAASSSNPMTLDGWLFDNDDDDDEGEDESSGPKPKPNPKPIVTLTLIPPGSRSVTELF